MGWYCVTCGEQATAPGSCPRDRVLLAPASPVDDVGHPIGDYTALGCLGRGGYGAVYRAVHRRSGATVAIKLLHRDISDRESGRAFVEARAAASIQHPNVVRVVDVGTTEDAKKRPYVVMELLQGTPLRLWWPDPMSVEQLAPIALDVLAGVAAAHAGGIVHRDLKPENVLVTREGRAIVVDFGLAKLMEDPKSPHLTITGEHVGTPRYMAPEQIQGKPVDARADVYAVGVILYEGLVGEPPFAGDAVYALFDAHLHAEPAPLVGRVPGIEPRVAAVIERALAKDPGRRYSNAGEMRRALKASLAPRKRWPMVAVGVAALVVGVIGGVVTVKELAGTGTGTTSGTENSVGPAPAPSLGPGVIVGPNVVQSHYVIPPPHDGAKVEPNLEKALDGIAQTMPILTRAQLVNMVCPVQKVFAIPDYPADWLDYYRRMTVLVMQRFPGETVADVCGTKR